MTAAERGELLEKANRLAQAGKLPLRYVVGYEGPRGEAKNGVLEAAAGRLRLLGEAGPVFQTSYDEVERLKLPVTHASWIKFRVAWQDHKLWLIGYVPGEGLGYVESDDGSVRFIERVAHARDGPEADQAARLEALEQGAGVLLSLGARSERDAWTKVLAGEFSAEEAAADRFPFYAAQQGMEDYVLGSGGITIS